MPDSVLKYNNDYVYRQEYDDAFVVYNLKDDMYFMINKACLDFIVELRKLDTFTYAELQKKMEVRPNDSAFFDTILFLVKERILNIIH